MIFAATTNGWLFKICKVIFSFRTFNDEDPHTATGREYDAAPAPAYFLCSS
jgi:hypothetical protein